MTTTIGALLILAGLGCFLAFNLLGSTLDAQGFLHEPFALLPWAICCSSPAWCSP